MTKKSQYAVMLVTAPNVRIARAIARALLKSRAAACVNIIPRIESRYRWQGKIEEAAETLLIIKTTRRKVTQAMSQIQRSHPYEVPEIIALPIIRGLPAYLSWLSESLQPKRR